MHDFPSTPTDKIINQKTDECRLSFTTDVHQ